MLDTTASAIAYRGGEGVSVFPIPFPFLETSHVRAYIVAPDGQRRALAPGVDYSVNHMSDDNGELVLLGNALAEGEILRITRLVPLTQEILFHNQGPNSPQAIEEAADKLTMIAQQLQTGLDDCLTAPEGVSAQELSQAVADSAAATSALGMRIAALDGKIAEKSSLGHTHGTDEISGLTALLAAKADATQLQNKADANQLAQKAERVHRHAINDIAELTTILAAKVDLDDPRLEQTAQTSIHAADHALGGDDPLYPEDIGTLPLPPSDGRRYLASAEGWVEYVASEGGGEGGTRDHAQLANRDAANQHPQSAVQYLTRDLDEIRQGLQALDESDQSITASLALKADRALLPENGSANDLLSCTGSQSGEWKTPAQIANTLPLMSESQKGVSRLAADAGLELDAGGALRIAADNLVSKANIEGRLGVFGTRIDALDSQVGGFGAMAGMEDAPANGRQYARQNNAWQEIASSSGGGGTASALVGEIRLLPFRIDDLPSGWYFCNGDTYLRTSPQGTVLAALPEGFRSDWGVDVDESTCALPDLFQSGKGCFLRPVGGSDRLPGSIETDAIRNITGRYAYNSTVGSVSVNASNNSILAGAFTSDLAGSKSSGFFSQNLGTNATTDLLFDASRCVPTDDENRPVNIGMTPAIYLGV